MEAGPRVPGAEKRNIQDSVPLFAQFFLRCREALCFWGQDHEAEVWGLPSAWRIYPMEHLENMLFLPCVR